MSRRPMRGQPNPGRGGDGRRRLYSESPIARVGVRKVRAAGTPVALVGHMAYGYAVIDGGGAWSGFTVEVDGPFGPSADALTSFEGLSVVATFNIPNPAPDDDTFDIWFVHDGLPTLEEWTYPGPHADGGTYTTSPFTWPTGWNVGSSTTWAKFWFIRYPASDSSDWYDLTADVTLA